MKEVWRKIKEAPSYKVSNFGRVINTSNGKLSSLTNSKGYSQVRLTTNKKRAVATVHRLVAHAFILNNRNVKCVNHIDGDKKNNNVTNLEWVTQAENVAHAKKMGLMNVAKKLDTFKVLTIHTLSATMNNRQIAKTYKVSESTISEILNGNTWGFLFG